MDQDVELKSILTHMVVKEHELDFLIIYIPNDQINLVERSFSKLTPFFSVTCTSEEISIVTDTETWNNISSVFRDVKVSGPYTLLTIDMVLDLSLVGFLAIISTSLSKEGVSIFALSTYLKDHFLVKKEDAAKALNILNELTRFPKS